MIRFIKIILLFSLIFFLALVAIEPGKSFIYTLLLLEDIDRKLDRNFGSRMETVKIDNNIFLIPNEFVAYATRAKEPYKNSAILHLEFIWPSFLPVRLANIEELNAAKKPINYNVGRLWVAKASSQKIDESLTINPKSNEIVKTEKKGNFENFEKYQHYEKVNRNNKLRLEGTSYILRNKHRDITDAIYCYGTLAPKIYPPQCKYSFVDKGLLYDITFAEQPHLRNWKDWKVKSINFIDQYRIK